MEALRKELIRRTEAEATYTCERQRTNLERFRAYRDDFQAACDAWNCRRISEVVQDAGTIVNDTLRLSRKAAGIYARLRTLATDARFASTGDRAAAPLTSLPDRRTTP